MKANELRIGNIFQGYAGAHTALYTFDVVHPDMFSNIDDDGEINGDPIPLTEEWLLKFGFEAQNIKWRDTGEGSAFVFKNEFGVSTLNIQHTTFGLALSRHTADNSGFLSNRIEFVHQLQNLYFALTGEELTITNAI